MSRVFMNPRKEILAFRDLHAALVARGLKEPRATEIARSEIDKDRARRRRGEPGGIEHVENIVKHELGRCA